MINYFFHFFLLLIAGALVINGWFIVTRGQWKEEVDGTKTREGALVKGWWFFWFKEREERKRVWYAGSKLASVVDQINAQAKFKHLKLDLEVGDYLYASNNILIPYNADILKEAFDVGVTVLDNMKDGRVRIVLYSDEPNYVFPEWVRTMLAGCITCFSSLYGSAIFWTAYCYFGKDWFGGDPLSRCMLVLLTWIAYMLGLAYMNTYLYKKASK